MASWLFEGRISVYVLLSAIAAILLYQWWLRRHPKLRRHGRIYLGGAALLLLLAIGFHALDRFVETDREQIEARVKRMAAAVQANDLDGAFQFISDQFRSPGGRSKADFLALAKSYRRTGTVTEVVVWDFQFPQQMLRESASGRVTFQVKARGDLGRDLLFARCEADFDFNESAGWRLRSFQLFQPHTVSERLHFPY